jgi:hypothetical protein
MLKHLYPDFLKDEREYVAAERYWIGLWQQLCADIGDRNGWRQPWFEPLPPSISEGNPIFSAVSPRLKRGIRIIQSEPTEKGLELVAYPDTFGGSIFDPEAIHELVISCALSDVAAQVAMSLIKPWVDGKSASFEVFEAGIMTSNDVVRERVYASRFLVDEPTAFLDGGFADDSIHRGLRQYAA